MTVTEVKPGLLQQATFSAEAAFRAAQAQRPSGTVTDAEIDEEGGRLVYEFTIAAEGVEGVDEVQIDAMTGEVVSVVCREILGNPIRVSAIHAPVRPGP